MKKECVVCGSEFEAHVHNAKYCSVPCRNSFFNEKRRRTGRLMRGRNCVVCGSYFETTGHGSGHVNVCSHECRRDRKRVTLERWQEKNKERILERRHKLVQSGKGREYSRKSRLRNIEKCREREREYARSARLALRLVRELQEKGLEALL